MANNIYGAIGLTGGSTGFLDAIDGTALADKDIAVVVVQGTGSYTYVLNATSGAAESSPGIIAPDANGGDKRWILQSIKVDHIEEATAAHGVVIDGVQLKDGGALAITGGTNTFNMTNGTASLDVAAGAAVNVDANLTVGSAITLPNVTAGGIPYGSSANVLADLAKGAANLKMFMNAGATAPEWAAGIKVVAYTRDLTAGSGNVAYTGAGFLPKAAILIGGINDDKPSIGFTDFTTHYSASQYGAVTWYINTSFCLACFNDASNQQTAAPVSADADGMTLAWTKNNSPTGTMTFRVIYLR